MKTAALKIFSITTLILSLAACGNKPSAQSSYQSLSSGIVAGTDVSSDDLLSKSTVGLLISLEGNPEVFTCTGTLVEKNVIVTAAHCFEDYVDIYFDEKTGQFQEITLKITGGSVLFTQSFKDKNVIKRKIQKIVKHPHFEPKMPGQGNWNDVAVISFEGALPDGYQTVPLLKSLEPLVSGLSVTFAGYGITSPLGGKAKVDDSGTLRKGDSILTQADYEGNELMFELPESGVSTCQGDSGGPAYAKINDQITLIGVTSRGADEYCRGISISTSVAAHTEFLEKTINSLKLIPAVAHFPEKAHAQ